MTAGGPPILFYDGECGMCTRGVRFVLRHDRRGTLRFASLRGEHADALRKRHPELAAIDSMVWVEPAGARGEERIRVRSDASLEVTRYLGGGWRLGLVLGWVPRAWRDALYDWVARNRRRFTRRDGACDIPSPGERERFLDLA